MTTDVTVTEPVTGTVNVPAETITLPGQTINVTIPAQTISIPASSIAIPAQTVPVTLASQPITIPAQTDVVTGTTTIDVTTLAAAVAQILQPAPTLSIATTSLPGATQNSAYSASLAASNGTAPYVWSATGLPAGLSVSGSSITGTPTGSGTASVVLTVTDAAGKTATATLNLVVTAAVVTNPTPAISSFTPSSGPVGTVVTITGSGFTGATSQYSGLQVYTPAPARYVTDGTLKVINDTTCQYTIPADAGTTNQLYVGNASAAGWAGTLFTVTSTSVPAVPTGLTASPGNASAVLNWTGVTGATSYNVKRGTAAAGPFTTVGTATNPSYTDWTVTNGTTYYYVVSAVDAAGESANSPPVSVMPAVPTSGSVTITVGGTATAISPYIYGINFNKSFLFPSGPPSGATLDRMGGDRLTAYNWTTNASNSGSDGAYTNDNNFPEKNPGGAVLDFIAADQSAGLATMITFQMQGLVSGDEAGACPTTTVDMTRFKTVQNAKGAAFSTTPSTTGNVFMDEYAWFIDHSLSGQGIFTHAPTKYPVFAQLDNEPDIWGSTHKELGPEPSAATFNAKTIALATALKTQFPQMTIFGSVISGFYGLYSWNGTVSGVTPSGANWYVDQFCAAMKTASASFGAPLVDVFDFHWYSQITDPATGGSITNSNGSSLSDAQIQAIVQSPRSLWDTTFKENSWITADGTGGPIYIIPRIKTKIAANNPGMKVSITEYFNGGAGHIAGTIAQADNLGIFGAQGLYAACLWPLGGFGASSTVAAAFYAYRNFDGAGSNFGDTSIPAVSSNTANVAVYVSTDSKRVGRVVMVAINRSNAVQTTVISGQPLTGTAHMYQMAGTMLKPTSVGTQPVSGSALTITLPAYSVTTIDCF